MSAFRPETRRSQREGYEVPRRLNFLDDDMDWVQRQVEMMGESVKRVERRMNWLLGIESAIAIGLVGNLIYFLLTMT